MKYRAVWFDPQIGTVYGMWTSDRNAAFIEAGLKRQLGMAAWVENIDGSHESEEPKRSAA